MEEDCGLSCGLCGERYSEDRAPRNLGTCGHALCTPCVAQVIAKENVTCPECLSPFQAQQASDLVVNYPLLRLIRALDAANINSPEELQLREEEQGQKDVANQACAATSSGNFSCEQCTTHSESLKFRCMRCCVWVCQECVPQSHPSPPRGQCRVLPFDHAVAELKGTNLQTLASKTAAVNAMKKRLEKELSALDVSREQSITMATSLRAVMVEIEETFGELEAKLEVQNQEAAQRLTEIEGVVEMLRQVESSVETARTSQDLLSALEVAGDCVTSVEKFFTQEQHRQTPSLPRVISQSKQYEQHLVSLLETGRSIYTSREVGGRRRWARVTKDLTLLHLHALQHGAHPPDGVTVPYKMVRHLVPRESPSIFLDVGVGGVLRGRVYVRLFGDTPRSRQALLLCSGEQGPTYRGSCFHKSEHLGQPLELLHGGDYENNTGTGGRTLIPGISADPVLYKTEVVAGLMASGDANDPSRLAQFHFYLRQNPGLYDYCGQGVVTSGLDTLRTASRHHPVRDSVVQDCGLVIPL